MVKEQQHNVKKPLPSELNDYQEANRPLIPLHKHDFIDDKGNARGKTPRDFNWRNKDYSEFDAEAHMEQGGNVGVPLDSDDLVVDVDTRNFEPGDDPLTRLCEDTGFDQYSCPRVDTGSGGMHLYLKKPVDFDTVSSLANYKGIDFKSSGQVVAAGSVHPNGKLYRWNSLMPPLWETPEAPARMLELLKRPEKKKYNSFTQHRPGDHSPEELEKMLAGLDPEDFRDQGKWFSLMAACHYATAGEGGEEFIDWSTSDALYADHRSKIQARWDSLHSDGVGRITTGALYKILYAKSLGHLIPPTDAVEAFKDDPLTEDDMESIRQMELAMEAAANQPQQAWTPEQRKIIDEWVWIISASTFLSRITLARFDRTQWESKFAPHVPNGKGSIVSAAWKGWLPIMKFDRLGYIPDAEEFPEGSSGAVYNIWRPSGVEAQAGDVTWFLDHMEYMFPDEQERDFALDYLALLARQPAVKINFALLIRSAQGTGKSAIGKLMRRIIGEANTVEPDSNAIWSDFNDWQEGKQLAVIHEMMMTRSKKHEVANHLKQIITEDKVRINPKNSKAYVIENYINLLCFTNYVDAVHLEDGDRRWLVLASDAQPRPEEYYKTLFEKYIESKDVAGAAAVKHYLISREVKLNPKGRAPMTKAKESMRNLSRSDAEDYLLEKFEAKVIPFDFDLVRTEDVADILTAAVQNREIICKSPRSAAKRFFDTIGAIQPPHNTKVAGSQMNYRLWIIREHEKWLEAGPTARAEAYKNRKRG